MTSKYQDFSESLVVLGEPKCTSIFPTKGPHAGKETKFWKSRPIIQTLKRRRTFF